MYTGFKRCEVCEWLSEKNEMPFCLLKEKQVGLLTFCNEFKPATGNHISF